MKKKRFSESQIVQILKECEAGVPLAELKRLKSLEEENQRLKKVYADLSLDNEILEKKLRKRLYQGQNNNWLYRMH